MISEPVLPLDWAAVDSRWGVRGGASARGCEEGKLLSVSKTRTPQNSDASFDFVDLFAGVGGFHAALSALGGRCIFASEIDPKASDVYERNWGMEVHGDIVPLTEQRMAVPSHDVLAAGFPCQPFSKSGYQRGMEETRGTLFWNIARVLKVHQPPVILLENVRNLVGPRHRETWATIIRTLRDLGYRVSAKPTVFSPHLLPPELGGRPQIRDRVFITGTYVGRERAWAEASNEPLLTYGPVARPNGETWDPTLWDLTEHLPLSDDDEIEGVHRYRLSTAETHWIEIWEEFVQVMRPRLRALPGFPIWADAFVEEPQIDDTTPLWKANFLRKNSALYRDHQVVLDGWLEHHNYLTDLPPSRRKLEWQAQDAESLWSTILHFRPSGIRAKKATYVPALVAITQTTVVAGRGRRITPREAARLQGLPEEFVFGSQSDTASYKQMGNGVNVGAAYYVLRTHVERDIEDVRRISPRLATAILGAPSSPDGVWGSGAARAPEDFTATEVA